MVTHQVESLHMSHVLSCVCNPRRPLDGVSIPFPLRARICHTVTPGCLGLACFLSKASDRGRCVCCAEPGVYPRQHTVVATPRVLAALQRSCLGATGICQYV